MVLDERVLCGWSLMNFRNCDVNSAAYECNSWIIQGTKMELTCLDNGNMCKVPPVAQLQCRAEVAGRDRIVDQLNLFLQRHLYGPASVGFGNIVLKWRVICRHKILSLGHSSKPVFLNPPSSDSNPVPIPVELECNRWASAKSCCVGFAF